MVSRQAPLIPCSVPGPSIEPEADEYLAGLILRRFDSWITEFLIITGRAKSSFEQRDWRGARRDAAERLLLYENALSQMSTQIEAGIGEKARQRSTWMRAKEVYSRLVSERANRDVAETFFNSVTRKILNTTGIDRDVEFFHLDTPVELAAQHAPIFSTYVLEKNTRDLIRRILTDHPFDAHFEDLERDIEFVASELDLTLWPFVRKNAAYSIDMLNSCFFRNKVAYIVGRVMLDHRVLPIILPIYSDAAGLYIDSVLLDDADADNIFGFAYSPFQVDVDTPRDLVAFLSTLLPRKPLCDLYNAIGHPRHGKTVFYRDLHRFVHLSREQFVIAPGKEGAIMIVFTLPSYDYVFKVIKDRPCFLRSPHITNKETSRAEVRRRYKFVSNRDRVGRLVDTQEFEKVRFKVKRYNPELLREFEQAAGNAVTLAEGYVIIEQSYLQRKVTPLPTYLFEEQDPELIRRVVIDFGYFIKDLAATGLFPADLFNTWNYGVTEGHRVVLFDYDDVVPLEFVNFRRKPKPRDEYEEQEEEANWITAEPYDFFMDEIDTFLGIPEALRGTFCAVHKDLFTMEFWENMKSRVSKGEIIDIIPYDRRKRFHRVTREA